MSEVSALERRYGELSDEYEEMVSGEHKACYEADTECAALDAVLESMNDVLTEMKVTPGHCPDCGVRFASEAALRFHRLDRGPHSSPIQLVLNR